MDAQQSEAFAIYDPLFATSEPFFATPELISPEDVSPEDAVAEYVRFYASLQSPSNVSPAPPARPSARATSPPQTEAPIPDEMTHASNPTLQAAHQTRLPTARVEHDHTVFVRLEKIILIIDDAAEEFRWKKRAGVWQNANNEDVDVSWLVQIPGPLLQLSVRPGGIGLPVLLGWDPAMGCFGGLTLDDKELHVSLKEVQSMVDNSLARQFQGYYYSKS